MASRVERAILHNVAKLHDDQSSRCRDMAGYKHIPGAGILWKAECGKIVKG